MYVTLKSCPNCKTILDLTILSLSSRSSPSSAA